METQAKADPADFLRPFIEKAMDPEYQARRLAEEARRKQQRRSP